MGTEPFQTSLIGKQLSEYLPLLFLLGNSWGDEPERDNSCVQVIEELKLTYALRGFCQEVLVKNLWENIFEECCIC